MNDLNMTQELVKLGFSEKEADIYRSAVSLGTFSVNSLSYQTKIKRPTCYFVISNLMEKGLISKLAGSKKNMYIAEHPRNLVMHLKKNLFRAEQLSLELEKNSDLAQKPIVRITTGQGGVEGVYSDMLNKENETIKTFIDTDTLLDRTGNYFLQDWIQNRKNKNIEVKSLITEDPTFQYKTSSEELRESKKLPSAIKMNGSIGIYNDKIVYLSNKKDDFCVTIENKAFKETLESIFDYLWKGNQGKISADSKK